MTTQALTTYHVHYRRPAVTTGAGDEAQHVFPETVAITLCRAHELQARSAVGGTPSIPYMSADETCDVCDGVANGRGALAIIIERVLRT